MSFILGRVKCRVEKAAERQAPGQSAARTSSLLTVHLPAFTLFPLGSLLSQPPTSGTGSTSCLSAWAVVSSNKVLGTEMTLNTSQSILITPLAACAVVTPFHEEVIEAREDQCLSKAAMKSWWSQIEVLTLWLYAVSGSVGREVPGPRTSNPAQVQGERRSAHGPWPRAPSEPTFFMNGVPAPP